MQANRPIDRCLIRRVLAEIERRVVKQGKRNAVSRLVYSMSDKSNIAAWNQDLIRVLHVFNVSLIGSVGDSLTLRGPFRPNWQSIPT